MGCSESREDKKHIPSPSPYSFKTPLPLHIYQSHPSTTSTPKSSPTNKSPNKSPTNKLYDTPVKTHISRLNAIAHFKFAMFDEFQPNVQQEILHHIDKELQKQ